jgi:hypothetical protein
MVGDRRKMSDEFDGGEAIARIIKEHWNPEGCSWCHDQGMREAAPCCRIAAGAGVHAEHVTEVLQTFILNSLYDHFRQSFIQPDGGEK